MPAFFKIKPLFLLLLPVFFVLHGFMDYYDFVSVKDTLLLMLVYMGVSLLLTGLSWFFYRNTIKAALFAFFLMAFQFFFGKIQDTLNDLFPDSFITHYRFLLPVSFIFFLALFIGLRRRKKPFRKLTTYLNLLLLIVIFLDFIILVTKIFSSKKEMFFEIAKAGFSKCDPCAKPDIYFIVLDEYAGNTSLKEALDFNDSAFLNELKMRDFYVAEQSNSNYYATRLSIASTLDMNYLNAGKLTNEREKIKYSYEVIRENAVLKFLEAYGYRFYNFSIFDFKGEPAPVSGSFLPVKTKLITSQTFTGRLIKSIQTDILSGKLRFNKARKKIIYNDFYNNKKILRLTKEAAAARVKESKFIYTHFMMPHHPYYFDSNGTAFPPDSLLQKSNLDRNRYIQYMIYCNKKVLELINHILTVSKSPPVILLTGDHGFRQYQTKVPEKYFFMNLNAVYLPDKDYRLFYQNMTNVNLFRVLLNTQFQQHLPLLKDSTISLKK